ncbi:Diguanylate cyclase [Sulfidibacter corallicola]|uniref:diguanylate cyclase n=1 Tax=Sulfidibacter corallicola TaxID=2818388 RepID=A0A8A4TG69_SULCO|nr:GGDEF domain-containing protein [Sulfidibacter corallicola]QTD49069.1 diguanylate cyclase [Sulfidibacter corallicola]
MSGNHRKFYPYGVQIRLLSGFTLLFALTFSTSLAAMLVFRSIDRSFSRGVAPSMDAVVDAVHLSDQGQLLTNLAPKMVLAGDQTELLGYTIQFLDRHDAYLKLIEESSQGTINHTHLDYLQTSCVDIQTVIRDLDLLVAQRIDAQTSTRRVIPNLIRKLDGIGERIARESGRNGSTKARAWFHHTQSVTGLLFSISTERDPQLVIQRRKSIEELLASSKVQAMSIEGELGRDLLQAQDRLHSLILGKGGYFHQLERKAKLDREIAVKLQRERYISDSLNKATFQLVEQLRDRVGSIRRETDTSLEKTQWMITGFLGLSLVGAIAVMFYLERNVMRRLALLRLNMTRYVEHQSPIKDIHGKDELHEMYVALKDLIERVEDREARLRKLATTDGLTGVLNRRTFYEKAREEVERATRLKHPLSLIVMDIDHFKRINDRFGHDAGDRAIVEVANRCSSQIRKIDRFGRIGGEEFAAVLVETELADAIICAERMRKAVAGEELDLGETSIELTVSLGVTRWSPEDAIETTFKRADAALYKAKESGRNKVVS